MSKLIILGLLAEQPMSGYDIQQKVNGADAERWSGIQVGSIYHALKKLEQNNDIELFDLMKTGHRQKAVYQITDQGRLLLKSLVLDALKNSTITYPTSLYSGISLLQSVSDEEAIQALRLQKELLDAEYSALVQGEDKNIIEGVTITPLSKLTIENMFKVVQLQQEYIDNVLDVLENRNGGD